MDGVIEALVVRRTYSHPRETVWKAWTEARRMEKWFCPNPKHRVKIDVDLRVGGVYRIQMIPSDGNPWVVGGIYQQIDHPSDLGFTWKWEDSPEAASLVEVELREVVGGTEVVINHSQLESDESHENHGQGWTATMDRLLIYLDDPMEGMHTTSPDLVTAAAQIKQAKQVAVMAIARMRDTFSHVPDDQLFWSPEASAKHPMMILAHAAYSNQYFASVLRGDPNLPTDIHAIIEESNSKAGLLKTREQVLQVFEETNEEVLRSYDQLDPGRLTTDPRVNFVLTLVGRHMDGHAGQIDYIQTILGDLEDHFGM